MRLVDWAINAERCGKGMEFFAVMIIDVRARPRLFNLFWSYCHNQNGEISGLRLLTSHDVDDDCAVAL